MAVQPVSQLMPAEKAVVPKASYRDVGVWSPLSVTRGVPPAPAPRTLPLLKRSDIHWSTVCPALGDGRVRLACSRLFGAGTGRPSESASPCPKTSRWSISVARLRFEGALHALLAQIVGAQSSVELDEPVEVVVNCVVGLPLQVVMVVQEVVVEVITVLEEPLEAKDVESMTVSLQDGTALPFVHEAELEEDDDDPELLVWELLPVSLPVLLAE